MSDRSYDLTVLGVGNILWADEGFGVRCAERFNELYQLPPRARALDGGTLGMYLLEIVCESDDLLLFDCAELKREPGAVQALTGDGIGLWSSSRLSVHQGGINDVMASAALRGRSPRRFCVIGAQPAELNDYGGSLTPALDAAIEPALRLAVTQLEAWGYRVTPRATEASPEPLAASALERKPYESGRPSAAEACREGDPRFAVKR